MLDQKLKSVGMESRQVIGGVRSVAEMCNRLDREVARKVLEGIEAANPNLARLRAMRELAAVGRRAEKARYLPDVFLFGMHELHPSDLTLLEPGWAVGVGAPFGWNSLVFRATPAVRMASNNVCGRGSSPASMACRPAG